MKTRLILFTLIGFLFSFKARAEGYAAKDNVEAFWRGGWYKASIERVEKENLYRVHFYGYWASREESLGANLIRPIPERHYPEPSTLKEGDSIEFLEGDHWRPAVFVEMQQSKALIRYSDARQRMEKLLPIQYLWKVPEEKVKEKKE